VPIILITFSSSIVEQLMSYFAMSINDNLEVADFMCNKRSLNTLLVEMVDIRLLYALTGSKFKSLISLLLLLFLLVALYVVFSISFEKCQRFFLFEMVAESPYESGTVSSILRVDCFVALE